MDYPEKTPLKITIPAWLAKDKNSPKIFDGVILRQSAKAVYVLGKGTTDPKGNCISCGRELTHPVSILVGIGPECGKHYWDESVLGPYGFTKAHAEKLKLMIQNIKVEGWFPKTKITTQETDAKINIPANHPMLGDNGNGNGEKNNMNTVKSVNGQMEIKFKWNPETLAKVKTIPGRKFNPDKKVWTAPISVDSIAKLEGWGFDIDPELRAEENALTAVKQEIKPIDWNQYPKLQRLFDFQKKEIEFAQRRNGKLIFGSEMGLGKTACALGWLEINKKFPCVWVCPASLKLNAKKEIGLWMEDTINVHVASGKKPYAIDADILIINYDILTGWKDWILKTFKPQTIITDECHFYKNSKAKRTKAIKALVKSVKHFIAISGTVIVNRPMEVYNAISFVEPLLFPSFWRFAHKYCGAKHNGFGWDFTGSSNTKELHEMLKAVMIRHKKADVLKDLPPKIRTIVPIEINNRNEYDKMADDFIAYLKNVDPAKASRAERAEALARIEHLKQACIRGKLKEAIEWIENYINGNGKLVIFCTHTFTVNALMEHFQSKAVKIDGSINQVNRNTAVERFQNDNSVRLFVGNIKAAGVGLTLTAANSTCFLELGWTSGDHDQAEDRVHRIGQKADSVNAYYLIADNTIETEIAVLLDAKRKVVDAVLDGKETEDSSLLMELLTGMKNRMEDDIPF